MMLALANMSRLHTGCSDGNDDENGNGVENGVHKQHHNFGSLLVDDLNVIGETVQDLPAVSS